MTAPRLHACATPADGPPDRPPLSEPEGTTGEAFCCEQYRWSVPSDLYKHSATCPRVSTDDARGEITRKHGTEGWALFDRWYGRGPYQRTLVNEFLALDIAPYLAEGLS